MDSRNSAPLASYIDLLLDAVCAVDKQGRFVFVSAACERIFGYSPAELIGQSMIELVHPADRQRTLDAAREIMAGEPKLNFENRYLRKDGRVVHILWSARWSEVDQLRVAVARDITERKLAESRQAALYAISEAAHAAEDLLALFKRIHLIIGEWLPALNFSVALYDEHCAQLNFPYHVDDHEPQPEQPGTLTERLCAEVIRSGQPILLTPEQQEAPAGFEVVVSGQPASCWLGVPLNAQKGTIGALIVKSIPGGERYTEQDKELLQYVCAQVATAIERKQLHARLERMAQYDQLTQLPNRELLRERLKASLETARRDKGRMALLYVDLDRFKQVNDTLGHGVGDMLLQAVANRLKGCVRETDTVARIGGDEFVVLLHSIQASVDTDTVVGKIRQVLAQPLRLDGHSLNIQSSIGVARFPDHGTDEKQLFRHADEAMYSAKRTHHLGQV
ncbi:sensor domain-containing protein [Pseudomonas vancouverensis]|uniref:Sensor domain-containing diguanylate cyclase n=1 Tax=Pseudomonas vancouverensis TaxID=95300 RepID=A0A1H2P7H2_PSEVA|nr:sensor domain-containing diguanylate cyclase [Pseudomonas vancouverensis]KAB0499944.1 diguanylate cyclase [Pseudomonas vancouverensis]TDB68433.1 sensor domain-containing diguanylate cyclase [Pseudomonas vancouverensis]SDV13245.1 diguanylate cyclase with PAS/PAC and GAF sensors [Pseudomonas vancouverensis]